MQESPAELLRGIIQFLILSHHKNCTQESYSDCFFFSLKKEICLDEDDIAR